MSRLGVSEYPYQVRRPVGRPSSLHLVNSHRYLMAKYGISLRRARNNRSILLRLNLMKPEARRYMLKLVRGMK